MAKVFSPSLQGKGKFFYALGLAAAAASLGVFLGAGAAGVKVKASHARADMYQQLYEESAEELRTVQTITIHDGMGKQFIVHCGLAQEGSIASTMFDAVLTFTTASGAEYKYYCAPL